jgi:hypothetical protein
MSQTSRYKTQDTTTQLTCPTMPTSSHSTRGATAAAAASTASASKTTGAASATKTTDSITSSDAEDAALGLRRRAPPRSPPRGRSVERREPTWPRRPNEQTRPPQSSAVSPTAASVEPESTTSPHHQHMSLSITVTLLFVTLGLVDAALLWSPWVLESSTRLSLVFGDSFEVELHSFLVLLLDEWSGAHLNLFLLLLAVFLTCRMSPPPPQHLEEALVALVISVLCVYIAMDSFLLRLKVSMMDGTSSFLVTSSFWVLQLMDGNSSVAAPLAGQPPHMEAATAARRQSRIL